MLNVLAIVGVFWFVGARWTEACFDSAYPEHKRTRALCVTLMNLYLSLFKFKRQISPFHLRIALKFIFFPKDDDDIPQFYIIPMFHFNSLTLRNWNWIFYFQKMTLNRNFVRLWIDHIYITKNFAENC